MATSKTRCKPPLLPTSPTPGGGLASSSADVSAPSSLEMLVETCSASVPAGEWVGEIIHVPINHAKCHALVRLGDYAALHLPLRVQLEQPGGAWILATHEALEAGLRATVAGGADCVIRSESQSCFPQSLEAATRWSSGEGSEALPLLRALQLGPSGCQAQFCCDVTLRCEGQPFQREDGSQAVHISVRGELLVKPWFHASNKSAMADAYAAAKAWFIRGDDVKAQELCEKALKLADELRPIPREMGNALHLLGAIHLRRQSPDLALTCFERAVVIKKFFEGSEEPSESQISTWLELGSAQLQAGRPADAAGCLQQVVDAMEERDEEKPVLANAYHSLGAAYRALGRHGQAMQCYQRCFDLRSAQLGEDDLQLISPLNNLGAEAQQLLQHQEARAFYLKALALEQKHFGARHSTIATTLGNLGAVYVQLNMPASAVQCLRAALEVQRTQLDAHPSVARTLHNLGNALAADGQGQAGGSSLGVFAPGTLQGFAVQCLKEALMLWKKLQEEGQGAPEDIEDIAATLHSLGNIYRGGAAHAAHRCFSAALAIREALLGAEHPQTARSRHALALVSCEMGTFREALEELNLAVQSLFQNLGSRHPWTLQARLDAESWPSTA